MRRAYLCGKGRRHRPKKYKYITLNSGGFDRRAQGTRRDEDPLLSAIVVARATLARDLAIECPYDGEEFKYNQL